MRIFLDCLPCVLRQVLEASRVATDNVELHDRIMEESLRIISEYRRFGCSPEMARALHQTVKDLTGVADPYEKIKKRDVDAAKQAYPVLKNFLHEKGNSLYWALKIAATGNVIDSAICNNVNIEDVLNKELSKEFSICDIDVLESMLVKAENLLIIGDNAGETMFDRVLAEHLSYLDIVYAVRSEPVINDATVEDARASGLHECTRIVSTGCSAPGVIPGEFSAEFLDAYNRADIVISKGQGNYETLSDHDANVFFLLKAKCPKISSQLCVGLNEYVFKFQSRTKHEEKELI